MTVVRRIEEREAAQPKPAKDTDPLLTGATAEEPAEGGVEIPPTKKSKAEAASSRSREEEEGREKEKEEA